MVLFISLIRALAAQVRNLQQDLLVHLVAWQALAAAAPAPLLANVLRRAVSEAQWARLHGSFLPIPRLLSLLATSSNCVLDLP